MEREKTDQPFLTVEWSVENFTGWNFEVHGKGILKSDIDIVGNDFHINLYPKGIEALDENLVIWVYDQNCTDNFDLSIVDSKGSLLWKKTICDPTWHVDATKVRTSLIFEDVVNKMVQDPEFKDVITLRYTRKSLPNGMYIVKSKVDAFDRLLRFPSEILRDLPLNKRIETKFSFLIDEKFTLSFFYVSSIQSTDDGIACFCKFEPNHDALVQCYLYVINSDNSFVMFKRNEHKVDEGNTWNLNYLLPNDVIKKLSSLLIRLRIIHGKKFTNYEFSRHDPKRTKLSNILYRSTENNSKNVIESPKNVVSYFSEELMGLYQDQKFSDFQLRCGGATFPVHKIILSARSPVFKTMLSGDMREAASGSMDIEDLDPHTLGRFLAFLYSGDTGEAQLQWEDALKLYYVADKYQVTSLKAECVAVFKDQISVTNVCHILALADKHGDDHLTSVAQDFILNNYKEVLKSEEWAGFMKKDALLLCKTLTLLGEKIYKGI